MRSYYHNPHLWCCQQYRLPAFALLLHCVPFRVIALQRALVDGLRTAVLGLESVVDDNIGGLQTLQGSYVVAALLNSIGIRLFANDRHPKRWYFDLVRVTYTTGSFSLFSPAGAARLASISNTLGTKSNAISK